MISLEAYRARFGVFRIRGGRSQNLTKGSGFDEVDATLLSTQFWNLYYYSHNNPQFEFCCP